MYINTAFTINHTGKKKQVEKERRNENLFLKSKVFSSTSQRKKIDKKQFRQSDKLRIWLQ